jgi:methionyl-tRNA formyltransferase
LTFIKKLSPKFPSGGGIKINVAIVTVDEPFYIPRMIKSLIAISPPDIKYASIILVPARPKKMSRWEFISNQMQVFGFSQFIKIAGLYMLRKFLNAISYREYSVATVAKNNRIYTIKTDSLKSEGFLEVLKTLSLDVIVSIASSRIFGKSILSIPKLACLNVHAGMLPRYRGINPSFWALLNQERKSAVTVHYINEEIDDGEIIEQDIFDIEGINSLHGVYLKVLEIAPKTVINSLVSLNEGHAQTIKNEVTKSTYYSFPTKEDGKKFRALGLTYM